MNIQRLMSRPITVMLAIFCLYWYSPRFVEIVIPKPTTTLIVNTPSEVFTVPNAQSLKVQVNVTEEGETKVVIKEEN